MSEPEAPCNPDVAAADEFALRLMRVVPSLSTQALRMAFLRTQLQASTPALAARALDIVCSRADRAEQRAKQVMLSFTGLLQNPDLCEWFEDLCRCADEQGMNLLVSRLRRPVRAAPKLPAGDVKDDDRRVPDYGRGRTLTLGERKSLARRPSRQLFDKLLVDPHPSVIGNLLNNSVITEDDIVRLAAQRPLRPEIMAEIAQHPKWNVRRRVRLALVLNPSCPPELGVPLVGLLMRSELRTVVQVTEVHPEIRRAAAELLRR